MRADFGSCLDHLFYQMCQMNTRIGHIAYHQSCLGGFTPSPSLEPAESSLDSGDDNGDNASYSETNGEMTASQ